MPVSESRKRANAKYNAKAYEQLPVRVTKGKKKVIEEYAGAQNESLNRFVNRAIDESVKRGITGYVENEKGAGRMKIYTIIGGVNGTGKSSLTGVLKAESDDLGQIIDVDKLNIERGGVLPGGKAAVELINSCIERGINFTQETTLSGHKTAATAKKARESGYCIRLYYVGLSTVDECLRRIKNRVQKGGHNIPSNNVERRFINRFNDVTAVLPYCNEAVFYDNENGFRAVAEYRNGEIITVCDDVPEWMKRLKKEYSLKK